MKPIAPFNRIWTVVQNGRTRSVAKFAYVGSALIFPAVESRGCGVEPRGRQAEALTRALHSARLQRAGAGVLVSGPLT